MFNRIRQWLTRARQSHPATSTPASPPHTAPQSSTQRPAQRRCGCAQPPITLRDGVRVVITAHGINLMSGEGR